MFYTVTSIDLNSQIKKVGIEVKGMVGQSDSSLLKRVGGNEMMSLSLRI